jgi:hypothetical protein
LQHHPLGLDQLLQYHLLKKLRINTLELPKQNLSFSTFSGQIYYFFKELHIIKRRKPREQSKHKAGTKKTTTKHETKKGATKHQTKKKFFKFWGWGTYLNLETRKK